MNPLRKILSNRSKPPKELKDYNFETLIELEEELSEIIKGDAISVADLQKEKSQVLIENFMNTSVSRNYFNFLSYIIDHSNKNINHNFKVFKCFSEIESWQKAFDFFLFLKDNANINYDYGYQEFYSNRELIISKTHKELGKYRLQIENGSFLINENINNKIFNDLEDLIKKIGAKFVLNQIFKNLEHKYNLQCQRYFQLKNYTEFKQKPELEIPNNYIINICLKNLVSTGKDKYKTDKYISKVLNLSKRFVFIYDLQEFSRCNINLFIQHWSIEVLHKNILYDSVFKFKQMNPYKLKHFIIGFFSEIDDFEKKTGFSLNDYIKIIDKIYSSPSQYMIEYNFSLFTLQEIHILDKIAHNIYDINIAYKYPNNTRKINFSFKPLIKLDNSYLLVDKNYCAWNFYEVLLKMLNYPNIGKSIEKLVYKSLFSKYTLFEGEYRNSKNEDAECDLVIETSEKIIFIEVKKKAISTIAIDGDKTKIAEDLIDSFIHSQEQLLKHEFSIVNDGKIEFKNGSELLLKTRKIVKISLSLFDNYMLNDNIMASNLLVFFQNLEFLGNEKKSIKRNEIINNLKSKINKLKSLNADISDVYFLSLELFLFYANDSIDDVLKKIRNISYSTGDLYYELVNSINN